MTHLVEHLRNAVYFKCDYCFSEDGVCIALIRICAERV